MIEGRYKEKAVSKKKFFNVFFYLIIEDLFTN